MNAVFLTMSMYAAVLSGNYLPLVVRLGDNLYMIRENSQKTLFDMGEEGQPVEFVLEQAVRYGNDAEIRWRATKILDLVFEARETRRKAEVERQLALKQRADEGWNRLADKLFDYYPFIDSLWYDRDTLDYNKETELCKKFTARYFNGGIDQVFPEASWTDGRPMARPDQGIYRMASKRMGMDMLSQGVSPLTVNLLFQVMRVNDNLYLKKTLQPAETQVPEDIMPPTEGP